MAKKPAHYDPYEDLAWVTEVFNGGDGGCIQFMRFKAFLQQIAAKANDGNETAMDCISVWRAFVGMVKIAQDT